MTAVLWILLALFALLLIGVLAATVYLYRFGLKRRPFPKSPPDRDIWAEPPGPRKNRDGTPFDPYGWGEDIRRAETALYEMAQKSPRYTVRSRDGLTLAGRYFPPEGDTRGIVLMVHGYRSNPMGDFSCAVRDMRAMGMGCFLIEQRAHLTSEGDTITFGAMERYDILAWTQFLAREFPGTPVILDGISMGASTVMMAAGLDLPDNVRGIIADCGYTSMRDIFAKIIRQWFRLPPFPFLPLASLYCRIRHGFGFSDCTAQDGLAGAKVPVLMAHGTGDTFVPYEMSERIYNAVKDKIDVTLLTAEDAEHGFSYLAAYEEYRTAIAAFFDKCLSG